MLYLINTKDQIIKGKSWADLKTFDLAKQLKSKSLCSHAVYQMNITVADLNRALNDINSELYAESLFILRKTVINAPELNLDGTLNSNILTAFNNQESITICEKTKQIQIDKLERSIVNRLTSAFTGFSEQGRFLKSLGSCFKDFLTRAVQKKIKDTIRERINTHYETLNGCTVENANANAEWNFSADLLKSYFITANRKKNLVFGKKTTQCCKPGYIIPDSFYGIGGNCFAEYDLTVLPGCVTRYKDQCYIVLAGIDDLTNKFNFKIKKKLSSKIETNVRVSLLRIIKLLKQFYPKQCFQSLSKINNIYRTSLAELNLAFKHEQHFVEFAEKSPQLGKIYLTLMTDLLDEKASAAHRIKLGLANYGNQSLEQIEREARQTDRALEILYADGIKGLRQVCVKMPVLVSEKMLDAINPGRKLHNVLGKRKYRLTKSDWRTVCHLPSARWVEMIYDRFSSRSFASMIDVLEFIKYKPNVLTAIKQKPKKAVKLTKLNHFALFVETFVKYNDQKSSDFYPISKLFKTFNRKSLRYKIKDYQFKEDIKKLGEYSNKQLTDDFKNKLKDL